MIVPSCLHSSAFNFLSFSRQNFNHELVEWSFCSCCDVSAPNKSALNGHDFNSSTPHSIRFLCRRGLVLCRQPHVPMIESIFRASFRSFSTYSCVWMMAWLFLSLSPRRYISLMFTRSTRKSLAHINSTAGRFNLRFLQTFLQALIWCACLKSLKSNTLYHMKTPQASSFPFG